VLPVRLTLTSKYQNGCTSDTEEGTYHLIVLQSVMPSATSVRWKAFVALDLEAVVCKPRRVKGTRRRWGLGSDER
jgi:hypothetical protein